MSFDSVPILDLSLARDPETKSAFLSSLRNALLKVGFLYVKNTGINDSLIHDVIDQGKAFFDLPQEEKLKIQMKNVPSFLGSSTFPICSRYPFCIHPSITYHDPRLLPPRRRNNRPPLRPARTNRSLNPTPSPLPHRPSLPQPPLP